MSVASLLRNRSFLGLALANTILGAAMPMLLILSGLTGLHLSPRPALATLPASVQVFAGMVAAAPMSLLMGRVGRRGGFVVGGALTLIGALTATHAMMSANFALLCVAHFALGAGLCAFQFFRFAAAEVVEAAWQPVAISLMLTSGLIAAIGGPQLFFAAKDALAPVPFAGAYVAIAAISVLGLLPLAAVRIPRPRARPKGRKHAALAALRRAPVRNAIGIAAASQGVMMFLMIPTPLAMIGCGFSETLAGDVIRWHIVAMFAPSFFTGFLIRRYGATVIAYAGLGLLVVSALSAATGLSALHFYGALIVLGLGWNFGFVGATSLLAAAVDDAEKPAFQGLNDALIALVSTLCAFASGLVIATTGWTLLSLAAVVIVAVAALGLALDRDPSRSDASPL